MRTPGLRLPIWTVGDGQIPQPQTSSVPKLGWKQVLEWEMGTLKSGCPDVLTWE